MPKLSKKDLVAKLTAQHSEETAELCDAMAKLADFSDEQDRTIALLTAQVAEQNVRILFLLHKLKFRVRPIGAGGIVVAGQQLDQTITGYEFYQRERAGFIEGLAKDMQIASAMLDAAEAEEREKRRAQALSDGQGEAAGEGTGPSPQSGEPDPTADDSALPRRSTTH